MYHILLSISYLLSYYFWKSIDKCDRFEKKQADGCVLTNPLNATPLRPGSTFIDGFSKLIPQRIAVEISYLLVYCSWKSINKCGAGTQWRNVWWIRQGAPKRLRLLGGVTNEETAAIWNYASFSLLLLPNVLISNQRHSIIYWLISKSNSSKESFWEVSYDAYDKIHMWRISIVILHILILFYF